MFYIYTIQDFILVSASLLGKDLVSVVRSLISKKYIGKIIPAEGLCISISDFSIGQTIVNPGEGDLLVNVFFLIAKSKGNYGIFGI